MKIVTTLYLCSPIQTMAKAPGLLSEKKKKTHAKTRRRREKEKRTDTVTEK